MSDVLPFHVHAEIMKRLPVKSLIQFRSVSKSWKSLIDNSQFIAAHSVRNTQPQHLFVWYTDPTPRPRREGQYVSFVDDDSFPRQRFVPTLTLSQLSLPNIVGSSYGLLCFDGHPCVPSNFRKKMVVLLNPSIRKSIAIDVPDMLYAGHRIVIGFGVCPVTIDPKIIQITQLISWTDNKSEIGNFWNVNVYTLSSGKWRSLSSNLPSISIRTTGPQVVINRFIYWYALDYDFSINSVSQTRNVIMSFDITNEKFEVVDIPDSLPSLHPSYFSLCKLRESLVIVVYNTRAYDYTNEEQLLCTNCTVWMMEHSEETSFTKLFSIKAPGDSIRVVNLRNNGGPIMEMEDHMFDSTPELVVYEPNSELNSSYLISGSSFNVNSYIETLVLLGRSDCSSY